MLDKNKPKFVIVTPRQGAGGPIVLHALCQSLASLGYDARVFIPYWPLVTEKRRRPFFKIRYFLGLLWEEGKVCVKRLLGKKPLTFFHRSYSVSLYCPVKGCQRKWLPIIDDDTIVVYPEVVWGNPLSAKHVVRWLLYYYQFAKEPEAYGSRDVFIAYREQFDCPKLNLDSNLVQIKFFDSKLYKQINFGERKGCCYIIRKGRNRRDLPLSFDGPVIDAWTEEEKVSAFNKYKICYFYDTQTFYASIAAVCGCIPVVVMEKGCSLENYRKGVDSLAGVAFGEEDIPRALATRDELLKQMNFDRKNEEAVRKFLKILQKNFKIRAQL